MPAADDLLVAFEYHDPAMIRKLLDSGLDPIAPIRDKTPIAWLIEMYTRSNRFPDCLRVMLDAGATTGDPMLEALLLDEPERIEASDRRFTLECTYTSLYDVSALHVCAEYNSVKCARKLLAGGLDVDTRAGTDADGLGGHTPLFHTVNSNGNHCREAMELLVDAGANLDLRLKGVYWGRGFDWETVVFDVTPISYSQCGLYRQFHRRERDIYSNIEYLYSRRCGVAPPIRNVPNKYVFPPKTETR
jgi:hypothetical protein